MASFGPASKVRWQDFCNLETIEIFALWDACRNVFTKRAKILSTNMLMQAKNEPFSHRYHNGKVVEHFWLFLLVFVKWQDSKYKIEKCTVCIGKFMCGFKLLSPRCINQRTEATYHYDITYSISNNFGQGINLGKLGREGTCPIFSCPNIFQVRTSWLIISQFRLQV